MIGSRSFALTMVGLTLTASACGRTPPPPPPTPVAQAPAPREDPDAAARAAREAAERAAAEARLQAERNREILASVVYFDYDVSEVRDDARRALDAKLPILRNDPSIRLRIEGHADERGSTEYNLALGSRRAMAVSEYLRGYGVDVSRLDTVSYGEERPRASGSGEFVWSQNRRAEFLVSGGELRTTDAGTVVGR